MAKKSWFTEWWGLLIVILLVIMVGILLIWAMSGIANLSTTLKWIVGIFAGLIVISVIVGAIFSEGFRSFLLRMFGRRRR